VMMGDDDNTSAMGAPLGLKAPNKTGPEVPEAEHICGCCCCCW
jgi:hypothetical protein